MNSLIERMKALNRIVINSDEEFVLEVKHKEVTISELKISIKDINYHINSGTSTVSLNVVNPKGEGDEQSIHYHNFKVK